VRINGFVFLHGGISPALATTPCAEVNATLARELAQEGDLPAGALSTREDGPLWYRGLAVEPKEFEPSVDVILFGQRARAIVVAHTITPAGRIVARYGGKVWTIDTAMLPGYVPTGRASALEIRGEALTAIYTDRRDPLEPPPARPSTAPPSPGAPPSSAPR
jgi:hypothetical protein